MTPFQEQTGLTAEQVRRYRELLAISDADALHDLLVRRGAGLLDRDLPYIVAAVKNQRRSHLRRGAARYEVPVSEVRPVDEPSGNSIWDPAARIIADESLRELLSALADLDPGDLLVIWGQATGRSDAAIAALWDELGFKPPGPSEQSIRKRRERARMKVRRRLRSLGDD